MAANVIMVIFCALGLLVCIALFMFQMEREKEKAQEEVRRRQQRQIEERRRLIEARNQAAKVVASDTATTTHENLGNKYAAPYGTSKPKQSRSVTTSTTRAHRRDDDVAPAYPDYAAVAAVLVSTPEPVYAPSRDDSWTSCEPSRPSRDDSWTSTPSSSYDSGSSDSGSSSSCD